jgi:hypothetical protein
VLRRTRSSASRTDRSRSGSLSIRRQIISWKANDQELPELAVDGTGNALVTWRDDRDGQSAVYRRNLASSGTSPDAAAALVVRTSSTATRSHAHPVATSPRVLGREVT